MTSPGPVYLGVDIGGTKVAAGLVDSAGSILAKSRAPMVSDRDAATAFQAVRAAVDSLLAANPGIAAAAIGVSSPGPLDPESGLVINPPNLPCWRNFPLAHQVSDAYRLPTRVDNDANAAGLAEAVWGSGVGFKSVFYATIGTGIGTGIVLDGRIHHGRTGAAAEGGHVSIDYRGPRCGCGKLGCIEALASGPAIALRARDRVARSEAPGKMLPLAGGSLPAITPEIVVQAWRAGDTLAEQVLRETADLLAVWLGDVIDLLEPEVIVVGGGLGEVVSEWFGYISQALPQWSINRRCGEIPLRPAHYLSDAGIAGAAALCSRVQRR